MVEERQKRIDAALKSVRKEALRRHWSQGLELLIEEGEFVVRAPSLLAAGDDAAFVAQLTSRVVDLTSLFAIKSGFTLVLTQRPVLLPHRDERAPRPEFAACYEYRYSITDA